MSKLTEIIERIQNETLRAACRALDVGPHDPFGMWPASLSHHHARPGGLMEHTIEVCGIVSSIFASGNVKGHRDVAIAAALWHDWGKTLEYVLIGRVLLPDGVRSVSAVGNYVWVKDHGIPDKSHSHIEVSAAEFMRRAAHCNVDDGTARAVNHCILSHHGRKEWGAVEEPDSTAAWVLHCADMLSARGGASK